MISRERRPLKFLDNRFLVHLSPGVTKTDFLVAGKMFTLSFTENRPQVNATSSLSGAFWSVSSDLITKLYHFISDRISVVKVMIIKITKRQLIDEL